MSAYSMVKVSIDGRQSHGSLTEKTEEFGV